MNNKEIKSFPDCIKKINELLSEEEEEDYDDLKINKSSLKMALVVLTRKYFHEGELPYFICPTTESGIKIEYRHTDNDNRTDYRCENGKLLILVWKNGTIEKRFEHQEDEVYMWL